MRATGVVSWVSAVLAMVCVGAWTGCAKAPPEPTSAVSVVPERSFVREWELDLKLPRGVEVKALHTVGDFLFAYTTDRTSYVVDKKTGRLVTIHGLRGLGEILPPMVDGKRFAYPISTTVQVFGLDGKLERTVQLGSPVRSTGVALGETLLIGVVGLNGGRIRAIDPNRQFDTAPWEVLTFGAILAAPKAFDGVAFFATESGRVYAVNENGAPVWPLETGFFQGGGVLADLAVDEQGLYVASTDTRLYVLDRNRGRVLWQYFSGQPLYDAAIPVDEVVFLPVRGQGLVALANGTDGAFNRKPLWVSRDALKLLATDNDFAFVLLRGNSLGALSKKTGTVVFRSAPTDLDLFVTNPVEGGLLYGASRSGRVLAVRPVTRPGVVGEPLFVTVRR